MESNSHVVNIGKELVNLSVEKHIRRVFWYSQLINCCKWTHPVRVEHALFSETGSRFAVFVMLKREAKELYSYCQSATQKGIVSVVHLADNNASRDHNTTAWTMRESKYENSFLLAMALPLQ